MGYIKGLLGFEKMFNFVKLNKCKLKQNIFIFQWVKIKKFYNIGCW